MPIFHTHRSKNYLSTLALMIALTGCGSSEKDKNDSSAESPVDTSSLSEAKLRENIKSGITQGATSNTAAVTKVASNSRVFSEIVPQVNNQQPRRREGNAFIMDQSGISLEMGMAENFLDSFSKMIDFSSVNQDKNIYTFDPHEEQVCSDPAGTSTAEEIANCQTFMSHITFVVTVTKLENKEVTAATSLFKYDDATFAKAGFDETSGYYEILLSGMHPLLLGVNEVVASDDQIDVPTTMQGSVHIAFNAPTETTASLKISIPNAIKVINNTVDKETQITIAATDKLFSLATNGDANTLEVEISLNALDILTSDNDDTGNSFPLQLALSALTGKAVMTANGDKLILTGLLADGVKLTIDNLDAMLLNLKPLDAVLDASGDKSTLTFSKLFDLRLSRTNIRHYFSSDSETTDTLTVKADAEQGTTLTEYIDDIIKVVSGNIAIKVTDIDGPFEINASAGSCVNNEFDVIECPVQE
ncbi:MAG: hypothetical protein KAH03_08195 [Cocleimonas sp.]|nr:hypothetical protein [Cocleimonas sp.]